MHHFAILVAAATLSAAAPATPTTTIVVDNTGLCSSSRVHRGYARIAEMDANKKARELRAQGKQVRVVVVTDGVSLGRLNATTLNDVIVTRGSC